MNLKFLSLLFLLFFNVISLPTTFAQEWSSPEVAQMYQQGLTTLSRGNANEAIAIFQKIVPLEPNNFLVKKSLAEAYQLSGNFKNTLLVLDPIIASGNADAESYRVAAQAYNGQLEEKKALKIIAEGISKYPNSGLLYYEQGTILKGQKNYSEALSSWVAGISVDPNFHLNYYEAAIAYVQTENVIWAIIYGEIFINKEPNTKRSNDTRILLLDAYQKLFFTPSKNVNGDGIVAAEPRNFEEAVKKTYLSLFFVVNDGINTENLIMLRSRFAISWYDNFATKYPFSLFSFHNSMLQNGYFDVYNQWLFGKAENPQQYDNWLANFADDMSIFNQFRMKNQLQLVTSDNYNQQQNFKMLFNDKNRKATKR